MSKILCCPSCRSSIDHSFYCEKCDVKYPVVGNVPILINEKNSIFSFGDYGEKDAYSFFGKQSKLSKMKKLLPDTGFNYAAAENYKLFSSSVTNLAEKPSVLIIGGGETGKGMKDLLQNPNIEFIHTDVSYTDLIQTICDSHDLPFKDNSFDGVIVQAVLEHVVDPYRCVAEIHRVLKDGGIVYAETPFMQQVHGGAYDFTRFTWLGHRRLFREFRELKSGTCGGPGMALAWSWEYFWRSFVSGKLSMKVMKLFSTLTGFCWKYFDHYLKNKPNTLDASSGNYFMGKKEAGYFLTDKELINLYDSKKTLR